MVYSPIPCQDPLRNIGNIGPPARLSMPGMDDASRITVADNIRLLMALRGLNKHTLSLKSGVSNRMIGKMLADDGSSPTTATLDKIAGALGVQPWQLLVPDGHDNAALSKNAEKVLAGYCAAGEDGRRIMETQADYLINRNPANSSPGGPPIKKDSSRS